MTKHDEEWNEEWNEEWSKDEFEFINSLLDDDPDPTTHLEDLRRAWNGLWEALTAPLRDVLLSWKRGRDGRANLDPDPMFGITHFIKSEVVTKGQKQFINTVERPIAEHPHFADICASSSWQREEFVRDGGCWIHPDIDPSLN